MRIKFTLLAAVVLLSSALFAANKQTYQAYILKYAPLAAAEQIAHGIPASITLAQGIIESNAGLSELAQKCNNHFGIKCGDNWNGKSLQHHDDSPNECFRHYSSVVESYEDHSLFLKNRQRYSFLFDYPVTKYKAWAYGLSRAGYATDPAYADKLIRIIEEYDLAKYAIHPEHYVVELDEYTVNSERGNKKTNTETANKGSDPQPIVKFKYVTVNGVPAILVGENIRVCDLSNAIRHSQATMIRVNEYPDKEYIISAGDYVYLRTKKTMAAPAYTTHIVKAGESLHSISQMYGIKLSALYKMNNLAKDAEALEDMKLRLR